VLFSLDWVLPPAPLLIVSLGINERTVFGSWECRLSGRVFAKIAPGPGFDHQHWRKKGKKVQCWHRKLKNQCHLLLFFLEVLPLILPAHNASLLPTASRKVVLDLACHQRPYWHMFSILYSLETFSFKLSEKPRELSFLESFQSRGCNSFSYLFLIK
jgi:hypothetical protein